MIKLLDLNKINKTFRSEFIHEFKRNLIKNNFILSDYNKNFEKNFKNYINAKYCNLVGNGTDALEMALEALRLKPNSEVILPANTFIATAEAILRNNLKPVFCDTSPGKFTLDLKKLEKKITKKTSAIIVVHLYGIPENMKEIIKIAKKNNLKVIEDCSQAHGTQIHKKFVGTFGDVGTFSFFPGKILGGIGDGGCCVTNNKKISLLIKRIGNHGRLSKFDHKILGRNSRMDSINSIFLNKKLKFLNKEIEIRKDQFLRYKKKLNDKYFTYPDFVSVNNKISICYMVVICRNKRDGLMKFLKKNNIGCQIHYPTILPKIRYLNKGNYNDYNNSTFLTKKIISLPCGSHLKANDIDYIARVANKFYE